MTTRRTLTVSLTERQFTAVLEALQATRGAARRVGKPWLALATQKAEAALGAAWQAAAPKARWYATGQGRRPPRPPAQARPGGSP